MGVFNEEVPEGKSYLFLGVFPLFSTAGLTQLAGTANRKVNRHTEVTDFELSEVTTGSARATDGRALALPLQLALANLSCKGSAVVKQWERQAIHLGRTMWNDRHFFETAA